MSVSSRKFGNEMSMSELALGEVALGAVLGIVGTFVGVYTSNHFEIRREARRAKTEEWNMVVDEVYSPLAFDLERVQKDTLRRLRSLGEVLAKSPNKFPEASAVLITRISQFQSQHTQSQTLEDMLRKRSRLIKPSSRWFDLFLFYTYLRTIEEVFSFISTDLFKENPAELIVAVKSAARIGESLDSAVLYLTAEIRKLVILTAEVPQSQNYTPFFTEAVTAKIDEQIESIVKALVGD